MDRKYFREKIEQLKPHVFKTASDTLQGYVFGCMVGVFSPSRKPTLRNIHEYGKSFAKVSAVYSTTESVLEAYGPKDRALSSLISGAVAGGVGVHDRSGRSILLGAGMFGMYSGLSSLLSPRERK